MSSKANSPTDQPVVVPLSGELDASDTAWNDELDALLDVGHRQIVIDLLNVSFVDSSVVRALVNAHNRIGDDGWIRIVFTHHLIRRVIDICGLSGLLPQYTTVESALRGSPSQQIHPGESLRSGVNPPVIGNTDDEPRGNRRG